MRRAVEIDTNRLACPIPAPQSLLLFNNMHFLSVLTAATLAGAALAFPKEVFPRLPYRMLQLTFQHGHQGNDSCGVYGYFSPQYEFIENVGTMKTVGNSTICDIPGMLTSLSLKICLSIRTNRRKTTRREYQAHTRSGGPFDPHSQGRWGCYDLGWSLVYLADA